MTEVPIIEKLVHRFALICIVRLLTKLLLSRSHIRYCKFVSSSLSRCLRVIINNGIVPSFTKGRKCGNHGCLFQHSATAKADVWSCESFAYSPPIILSEENVYALRCNHYSKAFTWHALRSGLYDAYLKYLDTWYSGG